MKKQTVKLAIILALVLIIAAGYVIYAKNIFYDTKEGPLTAVEENQRTLVSGDANANPAEAGGGESSEAPMDGPAEQKGKPNTNTPPEIEADAGSGDTKVEKKVIEKVEPSDVSSKINEEKTSGTKNESFGKGDTSTGDAANSSRDGATWVVPEKKGADGGGDSLKETDSSSTGDAECRVEIAVVGKEGRVLYGPGTVTVKENNRWGLTALGALDSTGIDYKTGKGYDGFVVSIAGQANKGMAGWMYSVNDEVPMVAASEKKIEPGDRIIWWYNESINNPPPTWESLAE
ncbi:DUF4430 domain-containing protein [Thermosediminibacter litoriperuensis]|uniref:Uncharacterized protein DUF4430 n=1 Tax=Thermosediminibacter litoriperuensis TaxID=291989 RepID=A0A5S5AQ96_9FIRM|nr:DUF4430 domain-containing protein [Thermosediminibacter litoriperuensis]TYP54200.1 uncharacterized protein DUF4430 [Thermosediminibacter litoriperuensis]